MLKKYYQWKVITDDGLVKNPKAFEWESYPEWHGKFESEDAAVKWLEEMNKDEYEAASDLALITFYSAG